MALDKKDLEDIRTIVKDSVKFTVDNSEKRLEKKIDNLRDDMGKLETDISREISGIAKTQREFLTKFDNHETRITKLESEMAVN